MFLPGHTVSVSYGKLRFSQEDYRSAEGVARLGLGEVLQRLLPGSECSTKCSALAVQLDGKLFHLCVAVSDRPLREPVSTGITTIPGISPGINPRDTGNAGPVVLLLDLAAFKPRQWFESGDEGVSVHLRRLEGLALPAVQRVCKVAMVDLAAPLNGYQPRMGV